MKKNILILILCLIFFSCTSLSYNYTQVEFIEEYNRTVKYFNKIVESPIKKSDLRKLKRKFTFLKNQLYRNNDNYERLNEIIVKESLQTVAGQTIIGRYRDSV